MVNGYQRYFNACQAGPTHGLNGKVDRAAAVENDAAIEINARYRLPSIKFIKQAKKAGAKFTCGTNNGGRNLGTLEYCKRAIRECGLTKDDFFKPRPPGKKAIDRWKARR